MIFYSIFMYVLSIFTVEEINASYRVEYYLNPVNERSSMMAQQYSNRVSASSLVFDSLFGPSQQGSASSLAQANQQVLHTVSTLSLDLNNVQKELTSLTSEQLLILRNRLFNSNNFSQDNNNLLLGSTTPYEFCIMCRQLGIDIQPEFLLTQPSQLASSSSLPSNLQNNRIIEDHIDPTILSDQDQQVIG